jgi:nitrous oxide reductase
MNQDPNKENNSRRKFLKLSLLAGAGTVATGAIIATTGSQAHESGDKVESKNHMKEFPDENL